MKLSLFLAGRLSGSRSGNLSSTIIRLAVGAVALSMMVVTTSVCLVAGFKEEIKDKVTGFAAHIQLKYTDTQNAFESLPIKVSSGFLDSLRGMDGVTQVQRVVTKPAILRGKEDIEGVIMKGLDETYHPGYFKRYLLKGRALQFHQTDTGREAVISKTTARRLQLNLGDKLRVYFAGKEIKGRAFRVVGIYETGLEDLDKSMILCDMSSLRELNRWENDEYSALEVTVANETLIGPITERLHAGIPIDWSAINMLESHPEIFDWLAIVEKNENVVLGIMGTITLITLITCLLVILIERTPMIGLLKSMGAGGGLLRTTFLWIGARLFVFGILGGAILGLLFAWGQDTFQWIEVDQDSYFMRYLPVRFPWGLLSFIWAMTLLAGLLALFIPLSLIGRISPLKAIRFK